MGVTYPKTAVNELIGKGVDNMKKEKPTIGGLYLHFKGDLYQVVDVIRDEANRDKEIVVYVSARYGEKWGRDLDVFMSDVDAEKYPEFAGQKRFRYVGMPQNLPVWAGK